MPEMRQNTLATELCQDPLWELMRSPDPVAAMGWGPNYKGKERRGGPSSKGDGREGREETGDGKRGEGIPPPLQSQGE